EGSPGPVTGDPAHPYYSNATARRLGVSSNYRVADLTNPNVKPWANEVMKRENEKVLGGGIGFTARSSCMPAGVPTFAAFAAVQPIYFVQTPKQITMIFEGDAKSDVSIWMCPIRPIPSRRGTGNRLAITKAATPW